MLELGVAKGDKVGLWMPNIPEWVVAYYAIARIGAVRHYFLSVFLTSCLTDRQDIPYLCRDVWEPEPHR